MDQAEWGVGDLLYVAFLLGSALLGYELGGYRIAMAGFAVFVGLVDWAESRQHEQYHNPHTLAASLLILVGLLGCLAVPETRLATYFAGLGAVFFVQAVRHAFIYEANPVVLFRHGYPSLVGISIVCSALADGLVQFRRVLLLLIVAVFVFRKLYVRW